MTPAWRRGSVFAMPGPVNQRWRTVVDGVRRAADALLPRRCLACDAGAGAHADLCAACLAGLPWIDVACLRCGVPLPAPSDACGACLARAPPVAATRACLLYAAPVDGLLPRLKFAGDLACARTLGTLMAQRLRDAPRPDVLVPVPLHAARLRSRGFDQALELARPLARALGVPLDAGLLRRTRATAAQSRLDKPARSRNVRGAFAVARTQALPARVALVDDVMTTGATVHAAARALRRAGVGHVEAWVCARVP